MFDENGDFLFSIDGETMVKNHVREGAALDAASLEALKEQSDTRKAKDKALQYLSLRLYGERELYDKLCLKFDGPTSAAAVAEMVRLELLDDARFAAQKAAWLKTRHKSRREAQRQLAEKGVDRDLIDEALDEVYGDGDEREEIDRLVQRSYAAKLENGRRDAVYAALCRRGFAPRTVREALNDWADAQPEGWDE